MQDIFYVATCYAARVIRVSFFVRIERHNISQYYYAALGILHPMNDRDDFAGMPIACKDLKSSPRT